MKKITSILVIILLVSCRASFYTNEFIVVDKKPSETEGFYSYKLKNVNSDKPRHRWEQGYYSWYRDSTDYSIGDTFRFTSTNK